MSTRKVYRYNTKESIEDQARSVDWAAKKYQDYKKRVESSVGSIFTSQEELNRLYNDYQERLNDLKTSQDGLSKAEKARNEILENLKETTNGAAGSTQNLTKGWGDVVKSDIDKKITDLSKELDIATLKTNKNYEAAFILEGLYSSLGTSANEYREDLVKLAKGQDNFTTLTAAKAEELKLLVSQYQLLFKAQKENKTTTNDYAKEVQNLKDKIAIAKLESQGLTVEAKLLETAQKLSISTTGKQAQAIRELIQEQENLKLSQSGQAFAEQEVYNNKSQLEQIDIDEQAKLEKLNQWYQVEQQLSASNNQDMLEQERLFQEAKTAIVDDANKKREELQRASTQAILSASSDLFGGLADLVGNFSNESGAAYKALYAVSKGFAIANAALNLQTAISNASTLPYPANLGAMAQAAASGAQIASSISSLSYGGGRKYGGDTSADSFYRVGEDNKPEILLQGGKQYLLPGENGRVLSNKDIGESSGANIQWTFVVENNVSGAEVQQPNVDYERRIVSVAVNQAKKEIASDISSHAGDVWRSLSNSTNIQSKL